MLLASQKRRVSADNLGAGPGALLLRRVHHFVAWYNEEHGHSGIKYVCPMERHRGEDHQILSQREQVYRTAKAANPARWQGRQTRIWDRVESVWLNPSKQTDQLQERSSKAA